MRRVQNPAGGQFESLVELYIGLRSRFPVRDANITQCRAMMRNPPYQSQVKRKRLWPKFPMKRSKNTATPTAPGKCEDQFVLARPDRLAQPLHSPQFNQKQTSSETNATSPSDPSFAD